MNKLIITANPSSKGFTYKIAEVLNNFFGMFEDLVFVESKTNHLQYFEIWMNHKLTRKNIWKK